MATISALMPYLEQGYIAVDHHRIGPAYLHPQKQEDGTLAFEWTAYEMEGEWARPATHSKDHVLTWRSNEWGILCHTKPTVPHGGTSEYDTDKPEKIEQAIADGLAYKAKDFR